MTPAALQRTVFTDGTYADVFQPDTAADPFHGLYKQKRDDVLRIVGTLPPGSDVLDLGGGPGRVAIPLAQAHRVSLCDISERMLSIAVEAARQVPVPSGNLQVAQVDASEALPFAADSFDAAVALDLLVHLPDPSAALRELRRVLRSGGRLLVDMTNSNPLWTLRYPRYVGRRPARWLATFRGGGVLPEWQSIVRHQRLGEFDQLLRSCGFDVEERRWYGPRVAPKWVLAVCRRD